MDAVHSSMRPNPGDCTGPYAEGEMPSDGVPLAPTGTTSGAGRALPAVTVTLKRNRLMARELIVRRSLGGYLSATAILGSKKFAPCTTASARIGECSLWSRAGHQPTLSIGATIFWLTQRELLVLADELSLPVERES